jgi:transposase InsO family protein
MKPPAPSWRRCLSPLYHWKQVPVSAVQEALQSVFGQWGRPRRIRVDNGDPWASRTELPPVLALWWLGLGIEVVWNHPGRPTKNAKVERCHGLMESWAEPGQCASFQEWQQRLEWLARLQREEYRCRGRATRLETHPQLLTNPRRSCAGEEWEIKRVREHLARGRWPRVVSKIGQITLYGKPYQVGQKRAGETVWVRLDPERNEWVIQNQAGEELRRHAAEQITAERIMAMAVSQPRPPCRKKQRHNLPSPSPP